jgi:hypothetical protein
MSTLSQLRRAADTKRRAEERYRAALFAAVDELEKAGARDAYAQVAHAAGVSRQTVRELVLTARRS